MNISSSWLKERFQVERARLATRRADGAFLVLQTGFAPRHTGIPHPCDAYARPAARYSARRVVTGHGAPATERSQVGLAPARESLRHRLPQARGPRPSATRTVAFRQRFLPQPRPSCHPVGIRPACAVRSPTGCQPRLFMNALLQTTIHSLWPGKYSRVLRTRSLRPPRHGAQPCLRVPPLRASWHACAQPQRRLVALATRIHE